MCRLGSAESISSKKKGGYSTLTWRFIGNAMHLLNLLGIAAYGMSMVLLSNGDFFDPQWLEEGFCLHVRDEPHYWTSHDVSAYTIISISILGLGVLYCLKNTTAGSSVGSNKGLDMAHKLTFWALVGAIGHGMGHLLISQAKRAGFYPQGHVRGLDALKGDSFWLVLMKLGPGYVFFWIPLIKTYMIHCNNQMVAVLAFVAMNGALQLPQKFGFAYTQMFFFAGLSLDQLLFSSNKDFEYALWPAVTVLPSLALSWVESTACTTSFLMRSNGHVIYDAFMASSYIMYFLICWARAQLLTTTAKVD